MAWSDLKKYSGPSFAHIIKLELRMEQKIFENYGCVVTNEDDQLFVYFDSGQSSGGAYLKAIIDKKMYEKLIKSEKDAYEVIINLPAKPV